MKTLLKNIKKDEVLKLTDLVAVSAGQIASKTLIQNNGVSITMFAFDKDEEIGTHDSSGDAMVTVLEGSGRFSVGKKQHIVKAGETIVMPANIPHSVYALEPLKWLLVVVFPQQ